MGQENGKVLTEEEFLLHAFAVRGSDPKTWPRRRLLPHTAGLLEGLRRQGVSEGVLGQAMEVSARDRTRRALPGEWSLLGVILLLAFDVGLTDEVVAATFEDAMGVREKVQICWKDSNRDKRSPVG